MCVTGCETHGDIVCKHVRHMPAARGFDDTRLLECINATMAKCVVRVGMSTRGRADPVCYP